MTQGSERPTARKSGLVVKTVGNEVLIYDLKTHRAHSVNQIAAAVWRQCDGARTLGEIARQVRATETMLVSDEVVRYALSRLDRAGLLEEPIADGVSAGAS